MDNVQCDTFLTYFFTPVEGKNGLAGLFWAVVIYLKDVQLLSVDLQKKLGSQFNYYKLVNPESRGRHDEVSHKVPEA